MGSPLSSDLRERVVRAVSEGASRRQAAERFRVSPASAIRWQESFEREGRVAAKPQGGDRRSQHVEAHADLILRLRAEQPTVIPPSPTSASATLWPCRTCSCRCCARAGLPVWSSSLTWRWMAPSRRRTPHATKR